MIKKRITYTDYNGVERSEDFYFNLSKAEMTEMEFSVNGGMTKLIEEIVETKDLNQIVTLFKQIILRSYGKKSEDGLQFVKSPEIVEQFLHSEAYSVLFIELASDAEAAAAFINGVFPQASPSN